MGVTGREDWLMLNPHGLHWSVVSSPDMVMSKAVVEEMAGGQPVEPMFIPQDLVGGDYFLTYRACVRHEAAAGDE